MIIGIVGGTGREGRGLALRWARAGHRVILGSRNSARADEIAADLRTKLAAVGAEGAVEGAENGNACETAEVVTLAVPFEAHRALLEAFRNALLAKVIIDLVVPLDMSLPHAYAPPREGSAAEQAQAVLGAGAEVVAALHHVAAHDLEDLGRALAGDVLLAGNSEEAKAKVASLVRDLGARPIDVGALKYASELEAITVLLIQLNRRYKAKSAAIRITGIESFQGASNGPRNASPL